MIIDMIHPDDASAVIIDSLWARMQLVDIEYSIPEAVKITSVGYDADILKRLKEYLIFPEILWKAGYDVLFTISIKTDNDIKHRRSRSISRQYFLFRNQIKYRIYI